MTGTTTTTMPTAADTTITTIIPTITTTTATAAATTTTSLAVLCSNGKLQLFSNLHSIAHAFRRTSLGLSRRHAQQLKLLEDAATNAPAFCDAEECAFDAR